MTDYRRNRQAVDSAVGVLELMAVMARRPEAERVPDHRPINIHMTMKHCRLAERAIAVLKNMPVAQTGTAE